MKHLLELQGLEKHSLSIQSDVIAVKKSMIKVAETMIEIKDGNDLENVGVVLRQIKTLSDDVEMSRKEIKRPVLDLGKRIDEISNEFQNDLKEHSTRLSKLIGQYQAAERARQQEIERKAREEVEAERKRIEDERIEKERIEKEKAQSAIKAAREAKDKEAEEEARRQAQENIINARREASEEKAEVKAVAKAEIVASSLSKSDTVTHRDNWKYEVTDINLLHLMNPSLITIEPNAKAIRSAISKIDCDKKEIPGLKIWNEPTAVLK